MDELRDQERELEEIAAKIDQGRDLVESMASALQNAPSPGQESNKYQMETDELQKKKNDHVQDLKNRIAAWEKERDYIGKAMGTFTIPSEIQDISTIQDRLQLVQQDVCDKALLLVACHKELRPNAPAYVREVLATAEKHEIEKSFNIRNTALQFDVDDLNDKINIIKTQHEKDISTLETDHETVLRKLKNNHDTDIRMQLFRIDQGKTKIEELEAKVQRMSIQLENVIDEKEACDTTIGELEEKVQTMSIQLKDTIVQKEACEQLEKVTDAAFHAAIGQCESSRVIINDRNKVIRTLSKNVKVATRRLGRKKAQLEKATAMNQVRRLEASRLRGVVTSANLCLQALWDYTRTRVETIESLQGRVESNKRLVDETTKVKEDLQKKVTAQEQERTAQVIAHQKAINELESKHTTAVGALVSKHTTAIGELESKHTSETDGLKSKHETELTGKSKKITQLEGKAREDASKEGERSNKIQELEGRISNYTKRENSLAAYYAAEFKSSVTAAEWLPFVDSLNIPDNVDIGPLSGESPWVILPSWTSSQSTGEVPVPSSITSLCGQLFAGLLESQFDDRQIRLLALLTKSLATETFLPTNILVLLLEKLLSESSERDTAETHTFDHFYLVPLWQVAKVAVNRCPSHSTMQILCEKLEALVSASYYAAVYEMVKNGCDALASQLMKLDKPQGQQMFMRSIAMGFVAPGQNLNGVLLVIRPGDQSIRLVAVSQCAWEGEVYRMQAPQGEDDIILEPKTGEEYLWIWANTQQDFV